MSEAWDSADLLYNSMPIGSERKRQLNPTLGGTGVARGNTAWREMQGKASIENGMAKYGSPPK